MKIDIVIEKAKERRDIHYGLAGEFKEYPRTIYVMEVDIYEMLLWFKQNRKVKLIPSILMKELYENTCNPTGSGLKSCYFQLRYLYLTNRD